MSDAIKHKGHWDWLMEHEPVPAENQTKAFIQWKGTDVCMDFYCSCGHHQHLDADFVYYVKCPVCDEIWAMAQYVIATKLEGEQLEYVKNKCAMTTKHEPLQECFECGVPVSSDHEGFQVFCKACDEKLPKN